MIRILLILLFFNVQLVAQTQTFRLFNGIKFDGVVQKITSDSIYISTSQGNVVKFHLNQIEQNTKSSQSRPFIVNETNQHLFQFHMGIFSGNNSIVGGLGLYGTYLHKLKSSKLNYLTLQSGVEALEAFFPVMNFPITVGYQMTFDKNPTHNYFCYGNAGWAFSKYLEQPFDWEDRKSEGGPRGEIGVGFYSRLSNHSAFYLGTGFVVQNMRFKIRSDWSNSDVDQVLFRMQIKSGVLF